MERPTNMPIKPTERWTGPIPVNQVVWEAAQEFCGGNTNRVFMRADLEAIIKKKYSDFKMVNIGAELSIDCVNSDSKDSKYRGRRRYWRVGQGKYRLYDPEKDKIESGEKTNQ